MYVTRPLSLYYNSPNAISEPPPEGPSSGILVVEDEAGEEQSTCCWGQCKPSRLSNLPLMQNKMIEVRYTHRLACVHQTYSDDVFFIPVIDQPLSLNRYYVVRAHGKNKGKTCTCSKKEGSSTSCLCCTFANDIEPTPFDHTNIYQQVELIRTHINRFRSKSVASDGIPPHFLRRRGWRAYASDPLSFSLGEAKGLNTSLRTQMPELDFRKSKNFSPPVVVGKWYCPSVFVKEGDQLKEQLIKPMFYEMTLEQLWEEVFARENSCSEGNVVDVSVDVVREMALLNGKENVTREFEIEDGLIWFKPVNCNENGFGNGFRLSLLIWERMRWEEERGGWVSGERVERVERVEAYEGENVWKKLGCYVLVERFVLKRMNGSVALTCEFKHTNKMRIKWE